MSLSLARNCRLAARQARHTFLTPRAPVLARSNHSDRHELPMTPAEFQRTYGHDFRSPPGGGGSHLRTTLKLVAGLGAVGVIYGVWYFYSLSTIWPPELRADLRAAVKAKREGQMKRSEEYFRKALQTADTMSDAQLDLLKRTGIYIALSAILPRSQAYDVLASAHARMLSSNKDFTVPERVRVIAIALQLAELSKQPEDEERWTVSAVGDAIKVHVVLNGGPIPGDKANMVDEDLKLPRWAEPTDLAVPYERLGKLYAKRGTIEYAVPLYLRATEILGPSKVPEDRCRNAQVMNNLGDALVSQTPTQERLAQSSQWITKGIAICQSAREDLLTQGRSETCEQTFAALLFNAGRIAEMQGDAQRAKLWYTQARVQSQSARYLDGVRQANDALTRV